MNMRLGTSRARGGATESRRSASTTATGPRRGRNRARDPSASTSSTRPLSSTATGAGSPTSSIAAATGYEVVRHEARAAREAGARAPALLLHRAGRADSGAAPRAMHVVTGLGETRDVPARRLRRLLPAAAAAVPRRGRATARRPTRTRSTTARSATSSRSASSAGTRTTTSRSSPASRARQVERLDAAGITTLDGARRRAARDSRSREHPRARRFDELRHQAELQLHYRATGRHRVDAPARSSRSAGFALLPEPSPGRHLARPRGRPVVRAGARARVPVRLGLPRRGRRAAATTCIWARDRAEEKARRSSGFVDLDRRAPPPLPRACTSTTTRRTSAPRSAADGRARHARGRARRPAARRGARRPLPRRTKQALRASRRALLDQGGRGALRLRAHGRGARRRRRRSSRFEQWLEIGERLAPRRDPRLQRGGLPSRSTSCTAGCSGCGRRTSRGARRRRRASRPRRARSGRASASALRGRAARRRGGGRPALAARAAARLPPPRGEAAVVGVLPPPRRSTRRSCSTDGDTIGGLELVGEPERDKQSLVYTFAFPAQEHKIGGDVRRSRDREGRTRSRVDDEHGPSDAAAREEARRRAAAARR